MKNTIKFAEHMKNKDYKHRKTYDSKKANYDYLT